ncbi:MAG TPA: LLM class flavin-dependent oxidoreductase [Candidatus Dormibacteraeota bacterium]|nr:LLM class flavin-dependent oxidoreductase [Candidatus Dormibacteraeota bacterium]
MTADEFALGVGGLPPTAALARIQDAERLGLARAFVAEAPLGVDAPALTAAALGATSRIAIGPGVAGAFDRHPVTLARAAATCEALAPGRTFLTVGRGDRQLVAGALGLPWSPAAERFAAVCRTLRALLDGAAPTEASEPWVRARTGPLSAAVRPVGRIPLWLAVSGPRGLRLAGSLADGVLLNLGTSPAFVRWAVAEVAAGARAAGRDPARVEIAVWCLVVVHGRPDTAAVRASARRSLLGSLRTPGAGRTVLAHSGLPEPAAEVLLRELGADRPDELAAALEAGPAWEALVVEGTRRQCRVRLEAYRAAGAGLCVLQPRAMAALLG